MTMSLYEYWKEHRFCPNCDERLTQRPAKPAQDQTRPHHRTEHRISDGVYNHSVHVLAPPSRNREKVDEDGFCVECGHRGDDLPRRIEGPQDVSIGAVITRYRRLHNAASSRGATESVPCETVCDYIAEKKRLDSPPSDEEILRSSIEDIGFGDIDTTAWVPVTGAARAAIDDEARRSPIALPHRPVATDGGRPTDE